MKIQVPAVVRGGVAKASFTLKKYSPEILLGSGLIGMGATVVMASRATLKAPVIIEQHTNAMESIAEAKLIAAQSPVDEETEEATVVYGQQEELLDTVQVYSETAVALVKLYGPAVIVGATSVAAILAAYGIIKKRHLTALAGFAALEETFETYRERVRKDVGDEKDLEYRYGVTKHEMVDEDGKKFEHYTVDDPDAPSMYARIFGPQVVHGDGSWDGSSQFSRLFMHNQGFLRAKEQWFNDMLWAEGYVFLNDVLVELGLERSAIGQQVGWLKRGDGDQYISFGPFWDVEGVAGSEHPLNGEDLLLDFNVDGYILNKI